MKPSIGVFPGDPTGIGPEIFQKLTHAPDVAAAADVRVIGDPHASGFPTGTVSKAAGQYVLETLRSAAGMLRSGEIHGFCYAPLNKQAMHLAGLEAEDEMRYLQHLLGVPDPVGEISICGSLWTSRVTSHIPLREVANHLTADGICAAIQVLQTSLRTNGNAGPRIAVAALNPHSSDGGTFGDEESRIIRPAVERARANGIQASGPHSADTVFLAARRGDFDAIVTMYHDQGQIAMKLLGFERGITLHGGMPYPITTCAHGTAYDIVGKGVASVSSLREAFFTACRMAQSRMG
jgi:4-hydroxythreonine-4-phosphate dehydrogenase